MITSVSSFGTVLPLPYSLAMRDPVGKGNFTGLILNGIPYDFPMTDGAPGTFLSTNGIGSLTWESIVIPPVDKGAIESALYNNNLNLAGLQGTVFISNVVRAPVAGAANGIAIELNSAPGSPQYLLFKRSGLPRFFLVLNGSPETGSNAGSNCQLVRTADNGIPLGTIWTATRSDGVFTITNGAVASSGNIDVTLGNVNINGASSFLLTRNIRSGNSANNAITLQNNAGNEIWRFQPGRISVRGGDAGVLEYNAILTTVSGSGIQIATINENNAVAIYRVTNSGVTSLSFGIAAGSWLNTNGSAIYTILIHNETGAQINSGVISFTSDFIVPASATSALAAGHTRALQFVRDRGPSNVLRCISVLDTNTV